MNIKHEILLKKAKKFFESFPEKTSAILKIKLGNVDTHWNVQRQKGQLQITEINSNKNTMIIKEDEKTIAGFQKSKKPFEYDPSQKPGTGTVAPGMEQQKYAQQKGSPQSIGAVAQSIRTSPTAQRYDQKTQQQIPPSLPSASRGAQMKMKGIRGTAKSDFEPEVIQKAAKRLSDQEFGQFYGFSKQSALKRGSTPPPLPSKVAKAGMKQYGESHNKLIKEASPAFAKISAAFMEYMSKQNDHVAQSNFINTISREKMGLVNKQEKDAVASIESQYLGQATKATDASTKQTPLSGMQQQKQQQIIRKPLTQGVERKYRVVMSEADGDIKGIDQSEDQPEQNAPEEVPEPSTLQAQQTSEEKAVSKLNGQTIKNATFESDENGNTLSLELAGTHQPATLEWNKTGKALFSFKGQKFVLKK